MMGLSNARGGASRATLLVLDTADLLSPRWRRALRDVAGVVQLHDSACLETAGVPLIDQSRYEFYRTEAACRHLVDQWAVSTVEQLERAGALPPYDGVELGSILRCWFYYQFAPDACACMRLARVIDVEGATPLHVVTHSRARAALFRRLLHDRRVPHRVTTAPASMFKDAVEVAKPILRRGRDLIRGMWSHRRGHHVYDGRRLLFLLHHPTMWSRVAPIVSELTRRTWDVPVLHSQGSGVGGPGGATRDLFHRQFPPDAAATLRIHRYLRAFQRLEKRRLFDDVPGPITLAASLWRSLIADLLYTILMDLETLSRAVAETSPDVIAYTNRNGLGAIAHAAGGRAGVPTMLMQITESTTDDDVRHCRADIFTVVGEAFRELLVKAGVAEGASIVVTGSDQYLVDETDPARARAKVVADLDLRVADGREKIVLFISQPAELLNRESYRRLVFDSAAAATKALPEIRLVVKRHPREIDDGSSELFARALSPGQYAVVTEYDLDTLLVASDAVIVQASSVGLRAIAHHKPLIVIDYTGSGPALPWVAEGAALFVDAPEALADVLSLALHDSEVHARLDRGCADAVARYLGGNLRGAAGRIADAVERAARA